MTYITREYPSEWHRGEEAYYPRAWRSICCITYNHGPYIRDALEDF